MGLTQALPSVPFVDLSRQHAPLADEIDAALRGVIEKSAFINGPEVELFESEWAEFCEAEFAVGVGSGTAGLFLTLQALGIGPGDEVIVPANTFIATALAVVHLGAKLVLVDCDQEAGTIEVDATARAQTKQTRAIIPVHLYGQAADLEPLVALAASENIVVVEDACQAHGARYRGRRVGGIGQAGCFSFYPSKNLGALGDAGAVVTNDGNLAKRLKLARDLGQARKYEHVMSGYNERLDTLQAAVLRVKLPHLDRWNALRRTHAVAYQEGLAESGVKTPSPATWGEHVWHLYVIRSSSRDGLADGLGGSGVQVGFHYPTPLHFQPALRGLGYRAGDFPHAEAWSRELLSLPMFPELEKDEISRVVEAVSSLPTVVTAVR